MKPSIHPQHSQTFFSKIFDGIPSRVLAAIVGGYVLTNLITILLSYLLPIPQAESVMVSMLSSFAIYATVIIWVFSIKTATKAWLGLFILSITNATWIYFLMPEALL